VTEGNGEAEDDPDQDLDQEGVDPDLEGDQGQDQ